MAGEIEEKEVAEVRHAPDQGPQSGPPIRAVTQIAVMLARQTKNPPMTAQAPNQPRFQPFPRFSMPVCRICFSPLRSGIVYT